MVPPNPLLYVHKAYPCANVPRHIWHTCNTWHIRHARHMCHIGDHGVPLPRCLAHWANVSRATAGPLAMGS
jgi:hypothetical protein